MGIHDLFGSRSMDKRSSSNVGTRFMLLLKDMVYLKETNDISILNKIEQRLHHHPIKLTLNFDLPQKRKSQGKIKLYEDN